MVERGSILPSRDLPKLAKPDKVTQTPQAQQDDRTLNRAGRAAL